MATPSIDRLSREVSRQLLEVEEQLDALASLNDAQALPRATCDAQALPRATCDAQALPRATCDAQALPRATCDAQALPRVTRDAWPDRFDDSHARLSAPERPERPQCSLMPAASAASAEEGSARHCAALPAQSLARDLQAQLLELQLQLRSAPAPGQGLLAAEACACNAGCPAMRLVGELQAELVELRRQLRRSTVQPPSPTQRPSARSPRETSRTTSQSPVRCTNGSTSKSSLAKRAGVDSCAAEAACARLSSSDDAAWVCTRILSLELSAVEREARKLQNPSAARAIRRWHARAELRRAHAAMAAALRLREREVDQQEAAMAQFLSHLLETLQALHQQTATGFASLHSELDASRDAQAQLTSLAASSQTCALDALQRRSAADDVRAAACAGGSDGADFALRPHRPAPTAKPSAANGCSASHPSLARPARAAPVLSEGAYVAHSLGCPTPDRKLAADYPAMGEEARASALLAEEATAARTCCSSSASAAQLSAFEASTGSREPVLVAYGGRVYGNLFVRDNPADVCSF